jgi:hypothetical protein
MPGIELASGTWQDAEGMIGKELSTMVGADRVELGAIRRKLEVLSFECTLHSDEETARWHGYEAIPSPVSMTASWSLPAYWKAGDPPLGDRVVMPPFPLVRIPAPGTAIMGTNVESEYFEPVYVGDHVTCVNRLVSIVHKRTRLGLGAFMTVESTYTKQTGEIVCVERFTTFRYTPDPKTESEL